MAETKQLTLRERNKIRTRQEIREAALEVFRAEGFADSSVEKIAKAAGTSKATVYVYFPDGLSDIYREIYAELSNALLVEARAARAARTDPVARIMALAECLFTLCTEPQTGAFYMMLSPTLLPVLAPVLGKASQEFTAMIVEDLKTLRSELPGPTLLVTAQLLVGAMREAAKLVTDTPNKKKPMLEGFETLVKGAAAPMS